MDRLRDEARRVVDDVVAKVLRKDFRKLRHGVVDVLRRGQGIGPGLLVDQQRHGFRRIEIAGRAIILRTQFDPADIADAGDPPSLVGLDDDVGELRRVGQPPQGLHVQLEGAGLRDGRLPQHAGRDLHVLRLQGRENLACRQVVGRDLVRV